MSEMLGRKVTISIGGTVIATARTKNLTINNEPVNVTSDGDDGIQRILSEPGEKAVELTCEGMFDSADETLPDLALGNDLIETVELDYGTYTISGDFFMASYNEGKPYNDAITFGSTWNSTGAIVKAAASTT